MLYYYILNKIFNEEKSNLEDKTIKNINRLKLLNLKMKNQFYKMIKTEDKTAIKPNKI
jgi:hypothetical protein